MSLKTELKNIILERGVVTLKEIEDYCHKAQYKLSNAERRLRELRGIVEPIYNDKQTAIIAYKHIPTPIYNLNGELLSDYAKRQENQRVN